MRIRVDNQSLRLPTIYVVTKKYFRILFSHRQGASAKLTCSLFDSIQWHLVEYLWYSTVLSFQPTGKI